jgi:hypothetical protein
VCLDLAWTSRVVHSYEDDPSKPVDWNEETVLLSPHQYQHLIAQMQRKLQESP